MDSRSKRCTAYPRDTIELVVELENISDSNSDNNNMVPYFPTIKKKILNVINVHYSKNIKSANEKGMSGALHSSILSE